MLDSSPVRKDDPEIVLFGGDIHLPENHGIERLDNRGIDNIQFFVERGIVLQLPKHLSHLRLHGSARGDHAFNGALHEMRVNRRHRSAASECDRFFREINRSPVLHRARSLRGLLQSTS